MGSARSETNGSQTVTATLTPDAFGQTVATTGSTASKYGYGATSGYRTDGDAGLMHVGARYYDAQVGRFTSRDTVLGEHPYLYCEHDPVNAVDPSGRWKVTIGPGFLVGIPYFGGWGDAGIAIGGTGWRPHVGVIWHLGGTDSGVFSGPGHGWGFGVGGMVGVNVGFDLGPWKPGPDPGWSIGGFVGAKWAIGGGMGFDPMSGRPVGGSPPIKGLPGLGYGLGIWGGPQIGGLRQLF